MNQNISVVGLGKLGACMLAVYASKKYSVIGVDKNLDYVNSINNGVAPVEETDLQKYITKNLKRIRATRNYTEAISKTEITFIIVPTPTDKTGGFSVEYVINACIDIGKNIKNKNKYHLVVLTSTVLPLDCHKKIIPVLEKYSGKTCGVDFGFCYSPEFIAIGSVIHNLLNPDFFLIGQFDKKSGDILESFYSTTCNNNSTIKRMSIPNAELTKISLNHFITMKITYANMLAEIADKLPSGNIDIITDAIGSDVRVGKKYLKGGLGFGGPCFPRDNRAFVYMAKKIKIKTPFAQITDNYNKSIEERMIKLILERSTHSSKIGIMGLSYKPDTGFCEESQGLNIAKKLATMGYKINAFESNGFKHAKILLGKSVNYKKNINEFVNNSDVIFLTNFDKKNQNLKKYCKKKTIIIDPWRQFSNNDFPKTILYRPIGINDLKI
ncbi:MAG: nucleotide sugar dehydrogenase [Candidatus Zambryskibacteria bacterium]|nr:nucleotide sugar dehydrogenase [Candidatus Zambryskibacteria bacterium]